MINELQKLQRELRRLKFQVPQAERGFVAALERICQKLLQRAQKL